MDQPSALQIPESPNWGPFVPGDAVVSVADLQPGDLVLERVRVPGFPGPRLHVVEILGRDPSGSNRPLVQARLVEPTNPTERLPNTPGWFVLWDFYLQEGRTEIFRAVRG